MDKEEKMDGLALGLHPIQNKVLVGTTESGESSTASSTSGKKVLQSETHTTGVIMERTQAEGVSTLDGLISNTTDDFSQTLEKNLEALKMEVESVCALINELLKDRQTLPEVKEWISMAKKINSKASSLLDGSIFELQKLSGYDDISDITPSNKDFSKMVCMTLEEVGTHKSKGHFKELVERAPFSHVKKMLPLQKIASPREMLLEESWKCLAENECQTLGLYGMAGVGKTTLLTQIKNKFLEVGYVPSLVIFVVVKSEKVNGIQDDIGEKLGLYLIGSRREKASEIFNFLKRKRFVLLLDGMKRKVDLKEIGIPPPSKENGCKIVFTTRSLEACGSKWVNVVEEVECLSPEASWYLFQDGVGDVTLKSHPDIPQLAKEVARKCRGLPFVLSLIGRTMSRKKTVHEWYHAIDVLDSSVAEFPDREFPILKFAYDSLPDENIKSCFMYCALFPENCDIVKQELVDCWISEGILEKEDRERAENKGYEMIGYLVRVGLLMESKSGYGVKLHGMVFEMAKWVTSDFGQGDENVVVKCGERIHQMPTVNDWNTVRRMSVTSTQIKTISGSPRCSKLTTLFLQDNEKLIRISSDFFRWMTSLVVLNLSCNTKLTELSEQVSSLVSLQFLNLSGTWISWLPLGLKELKKLIHLDLDSTSDIKKIQVIASLSDLQVLRLFDSAPMDLSLMESLSFLTSLKELSLTVEEDSVYKWLLSSHRLTSCIRRLHLKYMTINDGVIPLLNAMSSLRELDILSCNIPEIAIDWRSNTIQKETVDSGNIGNIPQFRNIRKVSLCSCNGVRDLTWLAAAPSLEDLYLYNCPEIERVISQEKEMAQLGHTSEQPFQSLTRLSLKDLPELESIYWTPLPFPVLEEIVISGCPKLRRLPFNSESGAKGNQFKLNLDEEWIKGVEWEDEATKQRFCGFTCRNVVPITKEQKMDGLASELHAIQNKVLVGTTESGKLATESSISGKKVLQPETDAAYGVSTPHGQISNRTGGRISKDPPVFINLLGDDVSQNFLGFLRNALEDANINVSIDDHLEIGTTVEDFLVRIKQSRVALAIFSKEYTTSEWCLDELVKIKECMDRETLTGFPIFYNVDPFTVRTLKGQFGDNFQELKDKNRHDLVRTQKWEEALRSMADVKGMNLHEQSDKFSRNVIKSIVEEVKTLVDKIPMEEDTNSFMVSARKIEITHSGEPKNWTWSSIQEAPNQAAIEIVTMKRVYNMEIGGSFSTRKVKLIPGKKYKVVFVVRLEDTAVGWHELVKLSLKISRRDKSEMRQDRFSYLDYIGEEQWVDVEVGVFVAPPKDAPATITFGMYQRDTSVKKTGLVVKGVAIRHMD